MAVSVYTGAGGGVASFNGRTGKVVPANGDYTKAQVGLGNVDNTSDANKPISNATQAALNDKQSKITVNGILKGDGTGNITAANETEVELVSLPNICNPHLLDNWYFGNPVNQRGQTSYTGINTYTIDRWMTDNTVTVVEGGIKVKQNGYYALFYQCLEDSLVEAIAGKVVTYSALTTDGLMTVTTKLPASKSSDWDTDNAVQGDLVLDIIKYGSGKTFIRFFSTVDGTEATILAVKLELGSQQTLAHQENGVWVLNEIPDYGEQLRRCQRYALVLEGTEQFYVGKVYSSDVTKASIFVPTPVTMRATPVLTQLAATNAIQIIIPGNLWGVTALTVYDKSPNGVDLVATFTTGASADVPAVLRIAGGRLLLSADL